MSNKYNPEEKLRIARVKMQRQYPFYGYLSLKLKVVADESVGTAGVDGKGKMYYAPSFIEKHSVEEITWLWGHELGHLIFEHVALKGKRNHILWNMAGDYAINLLLKKDGMGKMIENCLYDEKYVDWTANQIYEDLLKEAKENMEKYKEMAEKGGMDNHDMWGELTEKEQEAVKREWQSNIISAAHAAQAAGGEVPEMFRGLIDELITPKISWRDVVQEKIRSHNKEEQTWNKVNRRRRLGAFNYPGTEPGEKVNFMVAIDVSGSFTQDMVTEAMSEVYGACREFQEVTIDVLQWDTRVMGEKVFTQDNAEEMLQYQIKGGGGTDFNCVINYLKDNHKEPTQLFVFTDLYFSYMPDPLICPTTFIVVGGNSAEAPYGDRIQYE